ncbi:hypothetical protein [Deinococcus aetherius]|uniref:hypothetical protein n=1 Tax=Deinococcus aetherius TaxID=200252 RepID=UPI002231DEF8|nr:hypothetical protein [Deinococcus aetherius]
MLRDGFLTLQFSPRGAEAFGVNGFRLRLELDDAERAKLREGLAVIFSEREPQEFLLE